MPKLSIIVPNYNYGRFADRFFGSIEAQSYQLSKVEIVFVDDGSVDDSLEQARKWAKRLLCERFEIHAPPRCGKPGSVRNHGLRLARGELLLTLDPDDVLHPEYLSACIEVLDRDREVDLVYTDYHERRPDGGREVRCPDFKQMHFRTQNVLPPTAVYRRAFWDAGIRYRDNTEYEDWDYWIRCLMAGAKFHHIPRTLYTYEMHDANYSHHARENDGHAKAMIVVNNPDFFHPMVQEWAMGYLRGRLHSQAFRRGYIPTPNDIRELLKTVEQRVLAQAS